MFRLNELFLSLNDEDDMMSELDPMEHIDVSFLNTDEVSLLNQVIENDKVVKTARRKALNNLRVHVEKTRTKQKRKGTHGKKCSLCDRQRSCFTKRQVCPVCRFTICDQCLVYVKKLNTSSIPMCRVCYEAGMFFGQSLSLREERRYGSHLLHESLKTKAELHESMDDAAVTVSVPVEVEVMSQYSSTHSLLSPEESVSSIASSENKPSLPRIIEFNEYRYEGCLIPDYEVGGEALIGVTLTGSQLLLHIHQIKDLPPFENGSLPNPYAKTYLLPYHGEISKRRTSLQIQTLSPEYDEYIKYNLMEYSDKVVDVVWLSVWNYVDDGIGSGRGNDEFLGEVMLPLTTIQSHQFIADKEECNWYKLQPISPGLLSCQNEIGGSIHIEIMYKGDKETLESGKGDLYISVKRARFISGICRDTFVSCQLLSDGSEHHHKTQVVSHQVNPVWNELHVVTSVDVLKKHKFVEFSIWDCSNPAFNSFMGGVILGPTSNPPNRNGCIDSEMSHWQAVLRSHNNWIGAWHTLRSVTGDYEDTVRPTLTPSISEIMDKLDDTGTCKSISDYQNMGYLNIPSIQIGASSESRGSVGSSWGITQDPFTLSSEVLVAIECMDHLHELLIHVNKARGLQPINKDMSVNPYVKTYLLPERSKKWKRKTTVKHKTLNPEYNETLKYVLPPNKSYSEYTIWLTVWNYETWRKNSILGEVRIPLHNLSLDEDTHKQWYTLDTNIHLSLKYPSSDLHSSSSTVLPAGDDRSTTEPTREPITEAVKQPGKDAAEELLIEVPVNTPEIHEEEDSTTEAKKEPSKEPEIEPANEPIIKEITDKQEKESTNEVTNEQTNEAKTESSSIEPANETANEATNEATNEAKSEQANESSNEPANEPSNETANEPINETANEATNETSNEAKSEQANESFNEPANEPSNETANEPTNETSNEAKSEQANESSNEPANEPSNEIANEPINEAANEPTNETSNEAKSEQANESFNEPANEPSNETVNEPTNETSNEAKSEQANESSNETANEPSNEPTNETANEPTNETSNEEKSEQVNESSNKTANEPSNEITVESTNETADEATNELTNEPTNELTNEPNKKLTIEPIEDTASEVVPKVKPVEDLVIEPMPVNKRLSLSRSKESLRKECSAVVHSKIFKGQYDITGEIYLSLMEKDGVLSIHVGEAKNLAAAAGKEHLSNPYVKSYLFPNLSEKSKRKTSIKRKTVNPVYDEILKYNLPTEDISKTLLWLSVWHSENMKRNKFLGEVYLPLEKDMNDSEHQCYELRDTY